MSGIFLPEIARNYFAGRLWPATETDRRNLAMAISDGHSQFTKPRR
jgi:hypothetical protein